MLTDSKKQYLVEPYSAPPKGIGVWDFRHPRDHAINVLYVAGNAETGDKSVVPTCYGGVTPQMDFWGGYWLRR